jgi:hypothetical protein
VSLLVIIALTATGLVWTNTLGAADRFSSLVFRARMLVAPPPDREIQEAVIVDEVLEPSPTPEPIPTPRPTPRPTLPPGETPDPRATPEPTPEPTPTPTPRPVRRKVDVQLRWAHDRFFNSQVDNTMCASSGVQIVLGMHGKGDQSDEFQSRIDGRLGEWESRRDAKAGGWGPNAIRDALEAYGVPGYEVRLYKSREHALRDSARILTETNAPVILIAWRGAHTWVMTGYRADADPTVFKDAQISGAYIYDPWYPRVSSIWGASDPPGTFQDWSEMQRNFLPWQRPEGAYPDRDGLYITVAPTVPMKDIRGGEAG